MKLESTFENTNGKKEYPIKMYYNNTLLQDMTPTDIDASGPVSISVHNEGPATLLNIRFVTNLPVLYADGPDMIKAWDSGTIIVQFDSVQAMWLEEEPDFHLVYDMQRILGSDEK